MLNLSQQHALAAKLVHSVLGCVNRSVDQGRWLLPPTVWDNMPPGQECSVYKYTLLWGGNCFCSGWEEVLWGCNSSLRLLYPENGAGSLHWCIVEGQKTTDLGSKKKMFRLDSGFFLRAVKQNGPDRLCSLCPWKFTSPDKIKPWMALSGLRAHPSLSGRGTRDLLSCFSAWTIL